MIIFHKKEIVHLKNEHFDITYSCRANHMKHKIRYRFHTVEVNDFSFILSLFIHYKI